MRNASDITTEITSVLGHIFDLEWDLKIEKQKLNTLMREFGFWIKYNQIIKLK